MARKDPCPNCGCKHSGGCLTCGCTCSSGRPTCVCCGATDSQADAVTSPDAPAGAHDYAIDGAGREWYRDADDLWWIKPTPDSPWFRQVHWPLGGAWPAGCALHKLAAPDCRQCMALLGGVVQTGESPASPGWFRKIYRALAPSGRKIC